MTGDPNEPKRTVFQRPEDRVSQTPRTIPDPGLTPHLPSSVTQRFGMAGALVGTTLNDNYEVTRYITQGGMGEIYEGRQIRGNVKVAIKVILPQYAADPEFYNLLEREADLLASLGHDAIVKFRGLSHDPRSQVDYLTLEYVHGPSLEQQMDIGPIDPDACRALLRRLAAGLDTAHEKGVYHRDLSPDNILLRDGMIQRATIIDFGIAKDADTNKKTVIGAGFGGKLGFAAPEAFGLFGRKIGAWTDIYSLALVVAAAARGKVIDMGTATPIDAIRARQSVPSLDGVEPWLASILARMLEPDPDDRLRTMSAVIAAVDSLPPVGTPFDAEAANAAIDNATPARPRQATIPPRDPYATDSAGPLARADDPRETTDLRLVRAAGSSTTSFQPEKPKSKLPLLIGGGVGLAAVVGIALAFSGGDTAPEATDSAAPATTVTADPGTTGAPAAATDWAVARATLAAIPCSDIRAVPPAAGATALVVSGWMAAGTAVPQTAGGFRIEANALRPVSPAPSPKSCATIDRLKQAAGDGGAVGSINLPAVANWTISQLQVAGGNAQVPIGLGALTKPLFIVNIDDGATDPAKQLVAAPLPAGIAALPYAGRDPVRYLQFFLTAPILPATGAETGDGAAIAQACAAGCESTSGWVILR